MGAAGLSLAVGKSTVTVGIGDLMILQIDCTGNPTINIPAGWSTWFAQPNGTILKQGVYWKVATASDSSATTIAITFSASTTARATFMSFGGVDTVDPANFVKTSNVGTSNAPSSLTVTVPSPNSIGVNLVTAVAVANITPPANYVERQDTDALSGSNTIRGEVATLLYATQGATGALNSSIGATPQAWVSTVVVLPTTDYPVFVSSSTAQTTTARNVSVTRPDTPQAGYAILAFVKSDSLAETLSADWGFIPVTELTTTGEKLAVFYKIVTASEPAAYGFSRDGVGQLAVELVCYRNVQSTAGLLGAIGINTTASGTSITANSITTRYANSMLAGFFSQAGINAGTTLITPPSNWPERAEIQLTSVADQVQPTAGATSAKTATSTVTAVGIAGLLEIKVFIPRSYSGPAMSPALFWGQPEIYTYLPPALEPEIFWGSPELYFEPGGVAEAPPPFLSAIRMVNAPDIAPLVG